jgi:hypothetical protein
MKLFKIILASLILSSSLANAQTGTPSTLRVRVDANNYLILTGLAQTSPISSPTVFSNTRIRTDSNGYLAVVLQGGTISGPIFGPIETDCSAVAYSFTGRTTTGLNSHAANTWNLCGGGTLGLSGNTTNITAALNTIFGINGWSFYGTTGADTGFGDAGVNNWGTQGGWYLTGRQNIASPTQAAAEFGGVQRDATTWPAVEISAVKHNTGAGVAYIPGTSHAVWVCNNAGVSPCGAGDGINTGRLLTMTGNGAINQSVTRFSNDVLFTGLGTSTTSGYSLNNNVASTVGTTVQYSPGLDFKGSAWNSGGSVNEIDTWRIENRPATVAGTTTETLNFLASIAGGGFNQITTLTSAGLFATATVNATTAFQVNGTAVTSGTTFLTSGSGMGVANVGANSCGTSAATIVGNNNLFTFTVGATAGTQCRVAFTVTAANAWGAVCNDDTTTIAVRTTAVDTTHVDVIGTFTAGDQVTCIAHPR